MKYRPEIDGLRAVAVIAVIVNHFYEDWLTSGYLGVDIFFVISGYVITGSLASNQCGSFGDFIGVFYKKRIKRILPALIFFTLVTSLLFCMVAVNTNTALATAGWSLVGASNIFLYLDSVQYFSSETILNPFTHTWSLGVEEQFYLLYPLGYWLIYKYVGLGRRNTIISSMLLLISTLSCILFVYIYPINQSAAYFLPLTRFWEMSTGCLVFIHSPWIKGLFSGYMGICSYIVLITLLATLYLPLSVAIATTVLVVLLTALLLVLISEETVLKNILTSRIAVTIGVMSYSLYLWHWGVLSLAKWTIGINVEQVPLLVLLTFLMAGFSYNCVELPFRYRATKYHSYKVILLGTGVAAALIAGLNNSSLGRMVRFASSEIAKNGTWWRDSDGKYREYCHIQKEYSSKYLKRCLGDQKNGRTAFLIGDSHARNFLPTIKRVMSKFEVRYLTMGYGCAYLPKALISDALESVNCSDYVSDARRRLSEISKDGDVIFVGQDLRDHVGRLRSTKDYFDNIQDLAQRVESKGVSVVIMDGTYPPAKLPEICEIQPWRQTPDEKECEKSLDEAIASYSSFDKLAQKAEDSIRNVHYVSLRTGLCRGEKCGVYTKEGIFIWHDYGHITERAAESIAEILKKALKSSGLEFMD